ncbi:MAG: DUF1059 domain-containing protein [Fluviicola sp.]|nr:MAG: DUF1059 domain-containing protein [Fluviicola sp.]
MKTMTCEELGGACGLEFRAETFEEIADMSMKHGMKMFKEADRPHLEAMEEMKSLRESGDIAEWFERKREEFEDLPEDD